MLENTVTEKILCVQLKQIGDVLMTTPALRALARFKPRAEIHFLTQKPSNQIFERSPYVSRIIEYPANENFKDILSLIKRLRRERYSTVVDFLGLPKTALLSRLTGAKRRVGFKLRGRSVFYTHALETPENLSYSALQKNFLLSPLGINYDDPKIDFFIDEKDRRTAQNILGGLKVDRNKPIVSVSPVSRREYKVWPAENFAKVCDFLAGKYSAQILFLWGPNEYHFVKAVRDKMLCESLPDYPVPSIRETLALFEAARLHIGNDNGPMHFAVAAGTPTVAVFGRPLSKNWTPPNNPAHLAIEHDPGCKNSCFFPKCGLECLNKIKPEAVIKAAEKQIAAYSPAEALGESQGIPVRFAGSQNKALLD